MDEEFASLLENGTWELEKLPDGFKALPMKWVYKIKKDVNGNIERYKARLVAKGYLQKQGVDFEEVYAPVSKHTTLSVVGGCCSTGDGAAPAGREDGVSERRVGGGDFCAGVQRGGAGDGLSTLHGLRQAPRAWHTRLKAELEALAFRALETDPALFMKGAGKQATYVLVWVDDILVAGLDREEIAAVKELLGAVFDVCDLAEATYFLGMEVTWDREAKTLKLTQKKLTGELLARYGMEAAKGKSVPINPGVKLVKTVSHWIGRGFLTVSWSGACST
jgi:hypothetical protein